MSKVIVRSAVSVSLVLAALAVPPGPAAAGPPRPERALTDVIPQPATASPDPRAAFTLTPATAILTAPGAAGVGRQLAGWLRPATGYRLPVVPRVLPVPGAITLRLAGADARVGEQGYQLDVTRTGVTVRARTAAGLFAGAQTLRQLLPAAIDSPRRVRRTWTVPGGRIVDFPRLAQRSAMLDLARHFHTPAEVRRYVDHIAQFKVNVLHLHLSDDQGWRIQIDSWPKLTTVGGGPGTGVDGVGPGFLTKADYTGIVRYAAERHITIVPEIDMPGHTNAAQSVYGELNCDGKPVPPRTDQAVGYSSLCIGSETTYRFVEDVIRELAALTPGPYLHIGGDEAHSTPDADYATFMGRVLPLVAKYGKRAVGWHEIANVTPPVDTVPQFWATWSDVPAVAAAAARGNKILVSPANKAYLDMKYTPQTRLGLDWAALIEVRDAYDWDPATAITGVGEESLLGVEAPLWSETLRTLDDIEFMAFPRLPAIAEIGWTPRASRSWPSFAARLGAFGTRFDHQGIDFYRSPQITWS